MVRGILTGLALALLAGAQSAGAGNRALLVGISNYPHLPAESQLRAPSGDALRMRDFLVGAGLFAADEVSLLLNSEATADRIAAEIAGLAKETAPGDRVLFYFSGHGTRFDDKDGDEDDGQDEVLVAADVLSAQAPGTRTLPGVIPDDIMALLLAKLADREVTVILDACHSGTATRDTAAAADPDVRAHAVEIVTRGAGREPMSPAADPPFVPATGPAGMVWAASAPAQVAWEEKGRSVFTDAFIEGLARRTADANRNGLITSAELLDFVRARATAWCKASRPCRESGAGFTPHFEGPPDAVLLSYRTEAPAAPITRPPAATPAPLRPAVVRPEARDILGATNEAGLSVRMVGGPRLRLGDEVSFVVESGWPGTLILFDVNPSGGLYQLSPSRLSRPGIGPIAAGVPVSVPEGTGPSGKPLAIRASGETGPGLVVTLLVEDEGIGIEEILGRNLALKRVPDAPAVLAALAARLRSMQAEGGTNRAVRWSAVYLDYTIDP